MADPYEPFPVFGTDGKLMGNLTGNQGQAPVPAISGALADSPAISSGQSKFNGWMNYFSGKATGLPSGAGTGPGGTNPDASNSPAGKAVSDTISSLIPRVSVIIVGLIFVLIGLAMFGLNEIGGPAIAKVARALPA